MRIPALAIMALLMIVPPAFAGTLPSPGELDRAETIARGYWRGNPPCGQPHIAFAVLPGREAQAQFGECTITFNAERYWDGIASEAFCTVLAHEWGHLVLGPIYFAATNPADPAHSPDPASVMSTGETMVSGGFAPCRARHTRHG